MKDKLISTWYNSKIYKLIKEVFIKMKMENGKINLQVQIMIN